MSISRWAARLGAFSLFLTAPTFAQSNANDASLSSRPPTDSELIAGVREYPAEVLKALAEIGQRPGLAKQLAENNDLLQNPQKISPSPSAELTSAVQTLARLPDAVAVAAAHPEALAQFAAMARSGGATSVENRTARLQVAYRAEQLRGMVDWQKALQANPTALRQYRDVLNKFCEDRRKQFAQFPVVTVTDERYYTACPPSDVLLDFLNSNAPPAELDGVLLRWFSEHSAEALDTAALPQMDGVGAPPAPGGDLLAVQPAEKRSAMWSREVKPGIGLGLMPIVLQPEIDQPVDARVAHAIMEHDRLWSPLWTPAPGSAAPVAQAAPAAIANSNTANPPMVPVGNGAVAPSPANPAPLAPIPAPPVAATDAADAEGPVYSMVPVGSLERSQPITAGSDFDDFDDDEFDDDGGAWVALDDDDVEVVVNVEDGPEYFVQQDVGYVAPQTVVVDRYVPATTVIYDYDYAYGGGLGFASFGWFGGGFCDPWWGGYWSRPVVCDPFYYSPVGYCYRRPLYYGFGAYGGFGSPFYSVGRYYNGFWSPRYGVRSAYANGFVSGVGTGFGVGRFLSNRGDGGVRAVNRGFRGRSPGLAAGVRQTGRGVRGTNNSFLSNAGLRSGNGNAFNTGVNGVRQTTRGLRGYNGRRGDNALISPRSGGLGNNPPTNNSGNGSAVRGLRPRGDGSGNNSGVRTLRRGGGTQDMQPIGGGNSGPRGTVRGLRPGNSNVGGASNGNNNSGSGNNGIRNIGRSRRGDGGSNLGGGGPGNVAPRRLTPNSGNVGAGNVGPGNTGNPGGGNRVRGLRPQSGPRFEVGNGGANFAPRRLNVGGGNAFGGGSTGARIAPRSFGGGDIGARSFTSPRGGTSGIRSYSSPRSNVSGGGRSFGGGGGRSFTGSRGGGGRGGVRGIR